MNASAACLEWVEQAEPDWAAVTLPHLLLEDSFLTGEKAENRLTVRYYRRNPDGTMMAKACFGRAAQGPPGHAHGGSVAALLDESMGGAAWMLGEPVVAAELTVRFRNMLPLGTKVLVETRVERADGRKIHMGSTLRDGDGTVYAEGSGLFIQIDPARVGLIAAGAKTLVPLVSEAAEKRSS
jgi:acyl-coenzyme A thioesterase PaaI-like protein